MANKKISQLTENTNPTGSEELVYADNNTNGKMTLNTMKTFAQPDLSSYATKAELNGYATTAQLAAKQDELVSGINIKTINNVNILGSGNISTKSVRISYDYSAIKGPAPTGYHVPTEDEWEAVIKIWKDLGGGNDGTNFGAKLKLPFCGYRNPDYGVLSAGTNGTYWSVSTYLNNAKGMYFYSGSMYVAGDGRNSCFAIRCFKDNPEVPTSSWTKMYGISISSGGIFWSSLDGLISLSSDGVNWITIQDKNLGATSVWNYGDTPSSANCGKYYQWGNNYGFPFSGTLTTSETLVDASGYGPGNYYSSSTYIKTSTLDWSSVQNDNLWGGVTGVVKTEYNMYNMFDLSGTDITVGGEYLGGIAGNILSGSYDIKSSSNNENVGQEHYLYIPTQSNSYTLSTGTGVSNPFGLTLPTSTTKACLIKFYCDSVTTMIISDCKIAS